MDLSSRESYFTESFISVNMIHSNPGPWDFKGLTVFIPCNQDSHIANHNFAAKVSQGILKDYPIYPIAYYYPIYAALSYSRVPDNEFRV